MELVKHVYKSPELGSEQVRRNRLWGGLVKMFCKGWLQNILTRAPGLESCSLVHFGPFWALLSDFWSFFTQHYILIFSSSYEEMNRYEEYGFSMCQFALRLVNK